MIIAVFRYDLLKDVSDQNERYWDVFGFGDLVEKIFRLYSDSAARVRIRSTPQINFQTGLSHFLKNFQRKAFCKKAW